MSEVTDSASYHIPVMLDEVVAHLKPGSGKTFVDATLGAGGHSLAIASNLRPNGRLIGIDRDPEAIAEAGGNLADYSDVVTLVQARFDAIDDVLDTLNIPTVDGVLFDLGVSSHQLDAAYRGFSFKDPNAPLDMRMNQSQEGTTAADLLNDLSEAELTVLIRENSDEKWAARIAKFVVERRKTEPFSRVGQLVDAVHAAIPVGARPEDKHAATRTFQALRIAVNEELTMLGHALEGAADRLGQGGVLVALTFHSLEDRIVKQLFNRLAGRGGGEGPYGQPPPSTVELLTKKPEYPGAAEIDRNPRARSVRLRAVRRL